MIQQQKTNTMEMEKTISIKVKGYVNSQVIWSQLILKGIQSKTGICEGFNWCMLKNHSDLEDALSIISERYGDRIEVLNVQDSFSNSIDWRSDYWRTNADKKFTF